MCIQNFCASQRARSAIFMISEFLFPIRSDRKEGLDLQYSIRILRWCFPFTEVLSPCALTLNSMFAEYAFANPHSRDPCLVKTSPHIFANLSRLKILTSDSTSAG